MEKTTYILIGLLFFSGKIFGQGAWNKPMPDFLDSPQAISSFPYSLDSPYNWKNFESGELGDFFEAERNYRPILLYPRISVDSEATNNIISNPSNMPIIDLSVNFNSNLPIKEFSEDYPSNMPIADMIQPGKGKVIPMFNYSHMYSSMKYFSGFGMP